MLSEAEALQNWLDANLLAVEEASTYITKKGAFNPPLEKPWPKWEKLRANADAEWYKYREIVNARLV